MPATGNGVESQRNSGPRTYGERRGSLLCFGATQHQAYTRDPSGKHLHPRYRKPIKSHLRCEAYLPLLRWSQTHRRLPVRGNNPGRARVIVRTVLWRERQAKEGSGAWVRKGKKERAHQALRDLIHHWSASYEEQCCAIQGSSASSPRSRTAAVRRSTLSDRTVTLCQSPLFFSSALVRVSHTPGIGSIPERYRPLGPGRAASMQKRCARLSNKGNYWARYVRRRKRLPTRKCQSDTRMIAPTSARNSGTCGVVGM